MEEQLQAKMELTRHDREGHKKVGKLLDTKLATSQKAANALMKKVEGLYVRLHTNKTVVEILLEKQTGAIPVELLETKFGAAYTTADALKEQVNANKKLADFLKKQTGENHTKVIALKKQTHENIKTFEALRKQVATNKDTVEAILNFQAASQTITARHLQFPLLGGMGMEHKATMDLVHHELENLKTIEQLLKKQIDANSKTSKALDIQASINLTTSRALRIQVNRNRDTLTGMQNRLGSTTGTGSTVPPATYATTGAPDRLSPPLFSAQDADLLIAVFGNASTNAGLFGSNGAAPSQEQEASLKRRRKRSPQPCQKKQK